MPSTDSIEQLRRRRDAPDRRTRGGRRLPCRLAGRNAPRVRQADVQVDGGSEFMAEFESACEHLGVPLHVLPPRRPQWNGVVERTNRSARTEFWSLYNGPLTVADVARDLARYEFFFNFERPHASLAYQTPNEYLVSLEAA